MKLLNSKLLIGMNLSTIVLTTLAIFMALFPHYISAAGGVNGGDQCISHTCLQSKFGCIGIYATKRGKATVVLCIGYN